MENDGREGIEWRMRRILEGYQRAQSVGDFKDAVLSIHTALEDAMNLDLDPEARDLPFSQKFQQLFPDLYDQYKVDELNRQRNHYAHPKRVFEEGETRETAQKLAELTIQVWSKLFHSRAPAVSFPSPAGAEFPSPKSASISKKPGISLWRRLFTRRKRPVSSRRSYTPFFRLPWLSLLLGIGLLVPALVLAGLVEYSLRNHLPGVWYWIVLPSALLLAAAYFAARGFWRFLRSLGLRRLVAGFAGGLAIAILAVTLFMPPSSPDWKSRLASSAVRVLSSTRQAGVEAVRTPFEWGTQITDRSLAPLILRLAAREPAVGTESVTAPEATPTPEQIASIDMTKMAIGAKVKVKTDGSRLRGRETAGINTPVNVYFQFGEQLTIVDGPREADGYTWWKVEGKDGSGWSAENYLVLIP